MSGQGLESTCQVENKSLTGSFYLYVYARGVCKSGFNPLNLVYILIGFCLLGGVKECIIFGVANWGGF